MGELEPSHTAGWNIKWCTNIKCSFENAKYMNHLSTPPHSCKPERRKSICPHKKFITHNHKWWPPKHPSVDGWENMVQPNNEVLIEHTTNPKKMPWQENEAGCQKPHDYLLMKETEKRSEASGKEEWGVIIYGYRVSLGMLKIFWN